MWSESQICGQKPLCSVNTGNIITTALLPTFLGFCPHISESDPPPEKTVHFGAKIIMEWSQKKFCGLVTCINGIFLKKIGKNRSILPSALAKRKFRSVYGVATTN